MSIANNLISTALLALQKSEEVTFTMTGSTEDDKPGFWFKSYANEDENDEMMLQVLVYMDETSLTGYSVMVDILDDEIVTILDQQIKTFKEFQNIFCYEYIQNVFDTHHK